MNLNRVLIWVVTIGLFGLLFLPLYVADGMFFPFITGKNFAFRIIVEIVFAIWLILLARKAVSLPRLSWVFITITSFVVIASLATIFGENPYRSFWSNFERMDGLITLFHLLAYFVVVVSVVDKEKLSKVRIVPVTNIREVLEEAMDWKGKGRIKELILNGKKKKK